MFEGEALGAEVAAAEGGEIGAEAGEAGEFGFGVFLRRGERAGEGGVTDLEEADEFGGHLLEDGGVEVVGEGVVGEGEGGLVELPVAEAVLLPVGQVLLFDWLAVEFIFQDGLHLWEGIDPVEDALLFLGTVEAFV